MKIRTGRGTVRVAEEKESAARDRDFAEGSDCIVCFVRDKTSASPHMSAR